MKTIVLFLNLLDLPQDTQSVVEVNNIPLIDNGKIHHQSYLYICLDSSKLLYLRLQDFIIYDLLIVIAPFNLPKSLNKALFDSLNINFESTFWNRIVKSENDVYLTKTQGFYDNIEIMEFLGAIIFKNFAFKELTKENVTQITTENNIKKILAQNNIHDPDIIGGIAGEIDISKSNLLSEENQIIYKGILKKGGNKLMADSSKSTTDIRKDLYNRITEKCGEVDFEKSKNLFNKAAILKYPGKSKNTFEYINESLSNNTFYKSIEQLSIITNQLTNVHDFTRGKIDEIILKNDNGSQLLAYKYNLGKGEEDYIIVFNGIQSKDLFDIERLFNKSGLTSQSANIDPEIEQQVQSFNSVPKMNQYFRTIQNSINLINISKKEGKLSTDRFNYSPLIMEPTIFTDVLELFYIEEFKEVLVHSPDNYFYINKIIKKKEQQLYVFNIKTVISDAIFRYILSNFDK